MIRELEKPLENGMLWNGWGEDEPDEAEQQESEYSWLSSDGEDGERVQLYSTTPEEHQRWQDFIGTAFAV